MSVQLQPDGFYHPETIDDVVSLVNQARNENKLLRVKGSGHSVPQSIYPDGFPYREAEYYAPSWVANKYRFNFQPVRVSGTILPVLLDRMNQLTFLDADLRPIDVVNQVPPGKTDARIVYARAQAGIHLGPDPYDPTQRSNVFNSLFYQLESQGLALPDTGGISHQTVGGFLSTGSSGGTLKYSLDNAIYQITFVDGMGTVRTATRGDTTVVFNETINGRQYTFTGNDLLNAVGVSMGLLGIIVEVVFKTEPRYDIIGEEHIRPIVDYAGWLEPFSAGSQSMKDFLYANEYSRILWWPQKKTQKMTVWKARRMVDADYNPPRSTVVDNTKVFIPKPYKEVNWVFGSPLLLENLGDLFYNAVAYWPAYLGKFIKNSWLRMFVQSTVETLWYGTILPMLLTVFVTTDKKNSKGQWEPQEFWDTWWRGLPMDNQMDDRLMPVIFTELWIPIQHTATVMNAMNDHYAKKGLSATSTFTTELYATKASEFWMSPAYNTDVFRVDVFLSGTDLINPPEYYQQFWDLLAPYHFRTHWGKWLPGSTDKPEEQAKWRDYLKSQFPKWEAFTDLRDLLDPQQVFVNEYWRAAFGIPSRVGASHVDALQWDDPTPPHLDKRMEADGVKPNQALLFGAPPLPKANVLVYAVSIIVGIASYFGMSWLMTAVLPWFVWNSQTAHVVIMTLLGAFIGIGTVITRKWSPILMIIVATIVIMTANILNQVLHDVWWTWLNFLGLPLLWSAIIGFMIESIVGPLVVWLVGSKLFRRYWPQ